LKINVFKAFFIPAVNLEISASHGIVSATYLPREGGR